MKQVTMESSRQLHNEVSFFTTYKLITSLQVFKINTFNSFTKLSYKNLKK